MIKILIFKIESLLLKGFQRRLFSYDCNDSILTCQRIVVLKLDH